MERPKCMVPAPENRKSCRGSGVELLRLCPGCMSEELPGGPCGDYGSSLRQETVCSACGAKPPLTFRFFNNCEKHAHLNLLLLDYQRFRSISDGEVLSIHTSSEGFQ
jgi:hypothetical protein